MKEMLNSLDAFLRDEEEDDFVFYKKNRFVNHLDSNALEMVEKIYDLLIVEENPTILDQMSSFNSHLPLRLKGSKIYGLGLNKEELNFNSFLTSHIIHDINLNPKQPFEENYFDVVINTVSVDYLTRPFEVFKDTARILKPGGIYIVVFSNRMFPQKAVKIWKESNEEERINLVKGYFESSKEFDKIQFFYSLGRLRPIDDKYYPQLFLSDPVFVVYAEKKGKVNNIERPSLEILKINNTFNQKMIESKKKLIKQTHRCPYCDTDLKKWEVPINPFFATWDSEYLYVCFNDKCDYFLRGWDYTFGSHQGIGSYRFMWDETHDACHPIPVYNNKTLKDGIISQG